MQHDCTVRSLQPADLSGVADVLETTQLFPPDMLAALAEPFLSGQAPHHWLVADWSGQIVGFAYAEPERMTQGTFNLLAIAVDPGVQKLGIGRALVDALIVDLRRLGGRVLLVETSSTDEFAGTRLFYERQSFSQVSRIPEFYTDGDDKITFWKRL